MLPNMGFGDWVIVLVLVLLLFGAKKLPELARAIGQSMATFKKGLRDGEKEAEEGGQDRNKGNKKKRKARK